MPTQGRKKKLKKKNRRKGPQSNVAESSVDSVLPASLTSSTSSTSSTSPASSSHAAISGMLPPVSQTLPRKGLRKPPRKPKIKQSKVVNFPEASYLALSEHLSTPISDFNCVVRRADLSGLELSSGWEGKNDVTYSIYRNPVTGYFTHITLPLDDSEEYAAEMQRSVGWKIHVSLDDTQDDSNLEKGWDIVRKHLASQKINHFKIINHESWQIIPSISPA